MYRVSKICGFWTARNQLSSQKMQVIFSGIARTFATHNGIYNKFGPLGIIPVASHKFQATATNPPGSLVTRRFSTKTTRFRFRHPSLMQLLKCSANVDTPNLAVLFTWMGAKRSQYEKYANLYLDKKCDVLLVQTHFVHALWPGGQLNDLVTDVMEFLVDNSYYQKINIQAMSGGTITWGFTLKKMLENPTKCKNLMGRIIGQVYDSPALMEKEFLFSRIAKAKFHSNSILASIISNILKTYISIFPKQTTDILTSCRNHVYENLQVPFPILVFHSRNDNLACLDCVESAVQRWREKGFEVYFQLWDDSPHVGHLQKHKKEYEELLHRFISPKMDP